MIELQKNNHIREIKNTRNLCFEKVANIRMCKIFNFYSIIF